jgi:hypothetical protein
MPKESAEILAMSDPEVHKWMLTGTENSYVLIVGSTEMNIRCALRIAKAADDMATANRDLVETTKQVVEAHHKIINETRNLVRATWGLVVVTLVLVVAEFIRK